MVMPIKRQEPLCLFHCLLYLFRGAIVPGTNTIYIRSHLAMFPSGGCCTGKQRACSVLWTLHWFTVLFRLEITFKIIESEPFSLPAGRKLGADPSKFSHHCKVSFFSVNAQESLRWASGHKGSCTGGSKPGQSICPQPLNMPPAPLK